MINRLGAILIWLACYYYNIWDIIPQSEQSILVVGLIFLFFCGDEPIISYKKIVEVKKTEPES